MYAGENAIREIGKKTHITEEGNMEGRKYSWHHHTPTDTLEFSWLIHAVVVLVYFFFFLLMHLPQKNTMQRLVTRYKSEVPTHNQP